ncbi:MAG TPA: hypothetical protein VLE94_13000 [Burkholderiaceae bacterium]|nr:hypothetical protein [Burkholderiaceae bacterium]
MKRWCVMLVIAAVTTAATAQTNGPAPAASAPKTPYKRIQPLPPPHAPAVQRSKEATIPGDLKPEREPVPQIRIPLHKHEYSSRPPTGSGGIDDSVARCRAKRTSEEREACEAQLDGI